MKVHFGDESFLAVSCTGIDNQAQMQLKISLKTSKELP